MNIIQFIKTTTILTFFIIGSASFANATEKNDNPKKVKVSIKNPEKTLATTRLYFQGTDPTDPAQVTDPSLWTEVDNAQPCESGNEKPCSMDVNSDDVIPNSLGKLQLNPAEITLIAQSTASAYVPVKDVSNSNSTHPITTYNRD